MSYVNSVTVYPSSATITKGQWYYGAYASIASDCPECAEVEWYSNSPAIASVNATTGYIYGVSTGTTRIYAEATDGSGKKDYITVTVAPPVSVTGISICPTSLTLNVCDTDYLYETVYPSNATNQTVTWCSSDESVVEVNTYTGFVRAKKAGVATITACTVDGGYSASCTVTVFYDTVTIQKDGVFNKVVFQNSGKVWRCINRDMIFNDNDEGINSIWDKRSNHNFFTYYNESDPLMSNTTPKEYTDEEIKLLYAIDPYGVANYVYRFAETKEGVCGKLQEKDRIFRILFHREPKYFARYLDGTWHETTDKSNLSTVQSESETVFGMHPIWDHYTNLQIIKATAAMVDIALAAIGTAPKVRAFLKAHETVKNITKIFSFTASSVSSGFISALIDEFVENAFEDTELSWVYDIVSLYSSLQELVTHFNTGENYYQQMLDYCVNDLAYNVYIELQSGEKYRLKEIREAIKNE